MTFEPADWGPAVEGWLHNISDIDRHIEVLRERVETGEYQALSILIEGRNVGVLIWSVENEPFGSVIVVNALAGITLPGHDLTAAALSFIKTTGRATGAKALRFWTERNGLVRKCERHGMRATYVMEGAL